MCWLGRSIRTYSHLICSGAGGNARFDCYLFEWSLSFNSHGRFVSPFPDHPSARKGSMMHSLPCQSALHAQATLDLRLFGWTGSAFMLRSVLPYIRMEHRWAGNVSLLVRALRSPSCNQTLFHRNPWRATQTCSSLCLKCLWRVKQQHAHCNLKAIRRLVTAFLTICRTFWDALDALV